MKGIEKLTFITDEQKALLLESAKQYKRHARIYFEVESVGKIFSKPLSISIKVTQKKNQYGKYLSELELADRASEVFFDITKKYAEIMSINTHLNINTEAYNPEDEEKEIDSKFILNKMVEFNLSDEDLSKLLDLNIYHIRKIIWSKEKLPKIAKSAIKYLFLYLENKK